jgi:hypothetical protein
MQTKPRHTVVVIPNDKKLEVSYYCSDLKLKEKEKKDFTDLIIQLHDCHSSIKIPKAKIKDPDVVEAIVQKTVINARGHLCD